MLIKPNVIFRVHLFSLAVLAIAQPLYDLLGRNAEFFTVRNNNATDVAWLILVLNFIIPLILILSVEGIALINAKAGRKAHGFLIWVFSCLILFSVLKHTVIFSDFLIGSIVVLLSAACTYWYFSKNAVQLFVTYLWPTIIVLPLIFVFNTPVYYLFFPVTLPDIEGSNIKSDVSIVWVVFDELPLSTLLSEKYAIDEKLFPGFSALSKQSTWFVNAITNTESTTQALPSLLTGNLPPQALQKKQLKNTMKDWLDIPSFHQFPKNIFTALGDSYEMRVSESVTSLCPELLCEDNYRNLPKQNIRFSQLVKDLSVVYMHIVSPAVIAQTLPRIDMDWADFVRNDEDVFANVGDTGDVASYYRFINSISHSLRPVMYFHHATFPHGPWVYLPSGREYSSSGYSTQLDASQTWDKDTDVIEPYQRHILQTMYADKLLSEIVMKLKNENIFNDAVIIVTADHGASFMPGEQFRVASQNNYADISDIPLFIKYPNQNVGVIKKVNAKSIDVLPTIFKAINAKYPWGIDGEALQQKKNNQHSQLRLIEEDRSPKQFDYNSDKKFETVKNKINLFGDVGIAGIYAGKDHHSMLHQYIDNKCSRQLHDILSVDNKRLINLNIDSDKLPISITVNTLNQNLGSDEILVIAINHHVAAVVSGRVVNNMKQSLNVILHERFLISGKNLLTSYVVNSEGGCH